MPRDLADVLHYFLPGESADSRAPLAAARAHDVAEERHPAALPLVCVPIGWRDLVRASLTWSLAVEIGRLGGRAAVIAPTAPCNGSLWPREGVGPHGAEFVGVEVEELGALHRSAVDVAVSRAAEADRGGVVLVAVPPDWLEPGADVRALVRWSLLFTSTDANDLRRTFALAKRMSRFRRGVHLAVAVQGRASASEAQQAFAQLRRAGARDLGSDLVSYGTLVDDIHVYRALVSQSPIGAAHRESPAGRAVREVAEGLLADARQRALV